LRPAGLALAALTVLTVLPTPARAQRKLAIERFDATIKVEESGWVDVRERIQVRFTGRWNGIFRLIPVEYRTPQGFSYRLRLEDVSVRSPDGKPLELVQSRERHYRKLRIRVPGANNATRTVVIHYRIPNALKFWDDYDELYWNVTGDEWSVPIQSASAFVELPGAVTGRRTSSWTGGYGSTRNAASVQKTESGFYFETNRPLNYREGLTIAVAWDPGVVHRPGLIAKATLFFQANWLLFVPLISLVGMWRLWLARGKDPERLSIAPQFAPPDGLSPSEAGALIDNRVDMRDVTAALVDLAVRGYLRIEEVEADGLIARLKGPDWRLVPLKDEASWAELKPHEQELLHGVFGYGEPGAVRLSSLENEFYEHIPKIKDHVFGQLLARDFYQHRPDKVLQAYVGIGVGVGVLASALLIPLANWLVMAPQTAIVAAVGSALPILGFGFFMPARTPKGARAQERVLGFEEFLNRVESDRFKKMITGPEMFEAFLPYAMAFGVEKKWARAFSDLFTEPPSWYVGAYPGRFQPILFADSMSSMSSRAASVMGSAPRSSGGSGFGGGGGFSGGGFGGGGGGGW